MANSLVKKADKSVIYESNGEEVKLSPSIIKNYLVSGNGNVTDQEAVMFLNLCKMQHLNPFLREAYLIKFGNTPATMVTGKDTFMKRARRQKDFKGYKAGIVVVDEEIGLPEEREGTFRMKSETIIGGWAEVYVEGYRCPLKVTLSFDEYAARTRDGKLNSQWASKPGTMIRKCALVQALREAFPEDLGGLYSQEEVQIETDLPVEPVQIPKEAAAMPEPVNESIDDINEYVDAEVVEEDDLDDIFK